jgi:hypothetical protein
VRAAPAARVLLPFGLAALVLAGYGAVVFGLDLTGSSANVWTSSRVFWSETVAVLAIPVALAAGVLWSRSSRSAVADLVVELEHSPPGSVRARWRGRSATRRSRLGLWLLERRAFVDGDGRTLELPRRVGTRVTVLGAEDAPIARSSTTRRSSSSALFDAAGARRGSRSRTSGCRRSPAPARRGAFLAGPDRPGRRRRAPPARAQPPRRRAAAAARLGPRAPARPRAARREADGAAELLAEAEAELAPLDELRELARGIHPAILTEQAGRRAPLACRALDVPVTLLDSRRRLDEPVEAAAYFLVPESLANVAKYAHASRASVRVDVLDGRVLVEVEDDGVGGADACAAPGCAASPTGCTLDGELEIVSPPGRGTRIPPRSRARPDRRRRRPPPRGRRARARGRRLRRGREGRLGARAAASS